MGTVLTGSDVSVIRLLVVDDHPVVIRGVRTLVERDRTLAIVGEATSAADAVAKARLLQPDVVLLDLRLPDADVGATTSQLRSVAPRARIVVFTAYSSPAAMATAIDARVDGYLLKDASESDIPDFLRRAVAGESIFQGPGNVPLRTTAPASTFRR